MIFKPIAAAALFLVGQGKLTSATHDPSHWELKADIYPDDPGGSDPDLTPDYGFGWYIDYSVDTLIVGSYRLLKWDESLKKFLPASGEARVFVRSDPSSNVGWVQQGPPLVSKGYTGHRVAIDGDRAIVVAESSTVKMFVFERTDDTWAQAEILEFPDIYTDSRVALEGDIVIIGRPFNAFTEPGHANNGKVFIYKKIAGSWGAPQEIEAPEGEKKSGDYFGVDVAISNRVLFVGADERNAWDNFAQKKPKGKVYIFVDNNDGAGYVHSQTLNPDSAVPEGFRFGSYLALDGDNALIGNSYQDCEEQRLRNRCAGKATKEGAGEGYPSVFGFTRSGGTWEQTFTSSSSSCGYGEGVALKANRGLISDWNGNLRLIDLNDSGSSVDFYPFGVHRRCSMSSDFNGNWLALGNGEVFAGNWDYSSAGSVHVYDNFSEVPLGEEVLRYISSQGGGTSFSVTYEAGRGRQVWVDLFKSDCTTPIRLGGIIGIPGGLYPKIGQEKSLTHDLWDFTYVIEDFRKLDELGIYNHDTWQIEICHKASLVLSPTVKDVQVLAIDVDLNPEGVVAGSFGDPHIVTFDKLRFDCKAAGVFTTLTSLEDDTFKIQERFTFVTSVLPTDEKCGYSVVSTGVAVTDTGKPTVQISTPNIWVTSKNTVNGCPIDFFVDGTESVLGKPDLSGSNIVVRLSLDMQDPNRIKIINTDTLLTIDIVVQQAAVFYSSCHFLVEVSLPDTYRSGETLLGLLGTPNGDMTDDWVASDGTTVEAPANEFDRLFSTAYEYCVSNWCVQDSDDSLFTLRYGETFVQINQCGLKYFDYMEMAVKEMAVKATIEDPSINRYLYNVCSNDESSTLSLSCVVDGICGFTTYGFTDDASTALNDQWNIDWMNEETQSSEFSPLKTSSPAWEVKASILPDGSIDFTEYEFGATRQEFKPLSPDDGFGWSVGVSGETLIVGSFNSAMFDWETRSYGPGQGSARVFRRVGNSNLSWEQVQDPLVVNDRFNPSAKYVGYRVAIDGMTALIAATREANGVNKSKIFVFERSLNGVWEQTAILPVGMLVDDEGDILDDGQTPRVALQGDIAVCSAPYLGNGRVFVFKKLETWALLATLQASDGMPGDYFGADVSISGNRILIGASQQDLKDTLDDGSRVPAQLRRGKAYIFVNHDGGNGWIEEAIIHGDRYASEQLQFGAAVSLDGDTAFIGHGNFDADRAYVFHRSFGNWALQEKLRSMRWNGDSRRFGRSVAVLGDLAIVGGESSDATLFERTRSGWSVKSLLSGFDNQSSSRLGRKLALGSNFAVVGQVGVVEVFDDFSVVPPGPEEINHFLTFIHSGLLYFNVGYAAGYTHKVQFELFGKDCQTAIPETMFIPETIYQYENNRLSVSKVSHIFRGQFDPEALKDSVLHNKATWEVEVCVVASLVDSPVAAQDVFKIPFFEGAPPGAVDVIFENSWTVADGIWANYLIGRDQSHTAQLFQKDCMAPIIDTFITIEQRLLYTMNFNYESVRFGYTLDRTTVRESVIFNSASSEIEVCHVVALTDHDKVSKQVMRILVAPPMRCGGLFGDPHIMTFDELSFDCQAAGEFTTLTSLKDPTFKIQERFTAIESDAGTCAQASVSTGVVVVDTGKPVIQISTPRSGGTSLNTVNECPIDFYIDRTASNLSTDLTSSNIEVTLDEGSNRITIKHTDTLLALNVVVRNSDAFGCHIMVQTSLPGTFRSDETLLGLLGTPNGNKDDDWRMPNGTILPAPTSDAERLFSTAYDYCVENWCARTQSGSLFTYGDDESFGAINKCDVSFNDQVEKAVEYKTSLDPTLVNTCGESLVCLVDGLCGDITDAFVAMGSQEEITAAQVEVKTASVFPRERVDVQNVETVEPVATTTTTTSSAAASSTTTSSSTSNGSFTTTSSSTSNGSSMNRWYPNWGNREQTCKNDGNYQPYIETGNYIKKTLVDCCNVHYWWAIHECLILGGADSSQVASEEFYVDYESLSCKQSCFEKDSSATKNCGGLAPKWTETFKKAEDCCANKLFWVNKEACVAASTLTDLADSDKGSKKWYVDWITYKCVKDCVKEADEHCGGIAQAWDQTFETSTECCKTKLHWLKNSECTGQGNGKAI